MVFFFDINRLAPRMRIKYIMLNLGGGIFVNDINDLVSGCPKLTGWDFWCILGCGEEIV